MSQEKLKKLIAQLDAELEKTDITDKATRASLSQLMADVKAKLKNPADKESRTQMTSDLQGTALKFEVSHPKLTKILNEISNILSNIGI
jgi:hypothetical protein